MNFDDEFCVGRIWAGHNILRFDCVRIRDAFAEINLAPPEPKGAIDSLVLLTQKFGRRAGDMKVCDVLLSWFLVIVPSYTYFFSFLTRVLLFKC